MWLNLLSVRLYVKKCNFINTRTLNQIPFWKLFKNIQNNYSVDCPHKTAFAGEF